MDIDEKQANYIMGYRNGRLDKKLGIQLTVAVNSNIPGYSEGYADGQNEDTLIMGG